MSENQEPKLVKIKSKQWPSNKPILRIELTKESGETKNYVLRKTPKDGLQLM